VPPVVLQWLPFGISFAGLFMSTDIFWLLMSGGRARGGAGGYFVAYYLGYAVLMFGLLARIAKPTDQTARIIIAIGGGLLVFPLIKMLDFVFRFDHVPALLIVHNLLWFVVTLLGVLCILFVVPPQKLPPALQAIDALAPLIAAVLLLWMPLQIALISLALLIEGGDAVGVILLMARALLYIMAYFGVLMMTSPAAYDSIMDMVKGKPGQPGGGGYPPPPGGGYPPPGGGYPPQGGGYPPQGGGYPPQGGGYPQQGGGGGWQ
jgi:hypothetical protein